MKNKVRVNYLSVKEDVPPQGYWDMAWLGDMFDSIDAQGWEQTREVFIIPGEHQADCVAKINDEINKHEKVMVFITSDEQGIFPSEFLTHPDMYLFTQYNSSFPLGYTPQTRPILEKLGYTKKTREWFFAGQVNHTRRKQMAEVLEKLEEITPGKNFYPTDGFAKGLEHLDYFKYLSEAATAICPPGNVSHESFRVYEALEAGCVPILDEISAQNKRGYWDKLFMMHPLPVVKDYENELPSLIIEAQDIHLRNYVFSWWQAYKMSFRSALKEALGKNDLLTVVIPTSPIPSHPSTKIIEETIQSIRAHVDADIILTIDGVRQEQLYRDSDYQEYISRLLWLCNFRYKNIKPLVFLGHQHQSGMMKAALEHIETPLMMYVEHDTPLLPDREIDWDGITKDLFDGKFNAVRFHYDEVIHPDHEYLMEGRDGQYMKTRQWSQRPHVARTDFYKNIMQYFSEESNCFLEDRLYSPCSEMPWEDWKVAIYHPEGGIRRSGNLDGRGSDVKFEKEQVW